MISCEVFTAVSDMEILVPTVNQVAKHLDDYIQLEEIKLERLRWLVFPIVSKRNLSPIVFVCCRFRQSYENIQTEASKDPVKYLSNPINSYLLIKRLTSDWKKVETIMNQHLAHGILFSKLIVKILIFNGFISLIIISVVNRFH